MLLEVIELAWPSHSPRHDRLEPYGAIALQDLTRGGAGEDERRHASSVTRLPSSIPLEFREAEAVNDLRGGLVLAATQVLAALSRLGERFADEVSQTPQEWEEAGHGLRPSCGSVVKVISSEGM